MKSVSKGYLLHKSIYMTSQKRSKFKATDYWFKAEREETELITKGLKESFKVMESLCIFTVILCDCQNSEMYTT